MCVYCSLHITLPTTGVLYVQWMTVPWHGVINQHHQSPITNHHGDDDDDDDDDGDSAMVVNAWSTDSVLQYPADVYTSNRHTTQRSAVSSSQLTRPLQYIYRYRQVQVC